MKLTRRMVLLAILSTALVTACGCGGGGSDPGDGSGGRGNQILVDAPGPGPGAARDNANRILFTSNATGNVEIYSVNPDGSDVVRLTDDIYPDVMPVWSPDRTKIAFRSRRPDPRIHNNSFNLYVMDADGSNVRPVLFVTGTLARPQWAPDSAHLIVAESGGASIPSAVILEVNLDTSAIPQTRTLFSSSTNDGDIKSLALSPDGSRVLFSGLTGRRDGGGTFSLRLADETSLQRLPRIGDNGAAFDTPADWLPAAGPPPSTVLVTRPAGTNNAGAGAGGVLVLNPDDNSARSIVPGSTDSNVAAQPTFPVFSPSGSQIAYQLGNQVRIVNTDGTNDHALGEFTAGVPDW